MIKLPYFKVLSLLFVASFFMACQKENTGLKTVDEKVEERKLDDESIKNKLDYLEAFGTVELAKSRKHFFSRTNLVLNLKGTATGVQDVVENGETGQMMEGNCFEADLIYVPTGRVIGTGIDCLSKVQMVDGGLALVGTAIFDFGYLGTLTTQGKTSVQPKTHGSEPSTHITGAIPNAGANTIIGGTGIFKGVTGSVRLSGAVNMGNIDKNEITFDCLFVVDLD